MDKKRPEHHLTYKEIEEAQFKIAVLFLVAPLASDILIFVEWQTALKAFTIYPVLLFFLVQIVAIFTGSLRYHRLTKMKQESHHRGLPK